MSVIDMPSAMAKKAGSEPLPDVKDLRVTFGTPDGDVTAVNKLNFSLRVGETLGIVGESGSGKSQTAFALMGLLASNGRIDGSARFRGKEFLNLPEKQLNSLRAEQIAMIFQDPMTLLNPYMRVGGQLMEVLKLHKGFSSAQAFEESVRMLDAVKMPEARKRMKMYPHEFSGGQCQRIGIARALILEPKLIICDKPVSALDVSIQAQVVNLLQELQLEMGLSPISIAVVKHISDRFLVMYLGHVVEMGIYSEVYQHPYTRALMSAVPIPDPDLEKNKVIQRLEGELPSPIDPPSGCVFRTRCPIAGPKCARMRLRLEGRFRHAVSCLKVDPL